MPYSDSILILALGNAILGDDGIALKLLEELKERIILPSIAYKTSMTGGIEIVELLSEYNQVIILDSIKTMNGIPGNVYHFTPEDFNETSHISSFHDISFLTALKFADYIHLKLPKQIDIVAIEIVEDMVFTENFSADIRMKYPQLRQEVEEIILSLLKLNQHKNLISEKAKGLKDLNLE